MKQEKKTTIHNWNFGEIFQPRVIRYFMKFLLLFIVITSVLGFIGSFLTSTVKVDTSFYCSSGDIDLDTHSERVKTELGTRLKLKEVNVKGIDGMKCYGKVKAELPLIFALFM